MLVIPTPSIAKNYFRIYPRKALENSAKLLDHKAIPIKVSIIDISKGGMGLSIEEPKARGTPCAIAFDVPFKGMQRRINVWAKVVYCLQQEGGGCRIGVQILDCDAQSKTLIESLSAKFTA